MPAVLWRSMSAPVFGHPWSPSEWIHKDRLWRRSFGPLRPRSGPSRHTSRPSLKWASLTSHIPGLMYNSFRPETRVISLHVLRKLEQPTSWMTRLLTMSGHVWPWHLRSPWLAVLLQVQSFDDFTRPVTFISLIWFRLYFIQQYLSFKN